MWKFVSFYVLLAMTFSVQAAVPAPQTGAPTAQPKPTATPPAAPATQRGQRSTAKPPTPMTLRQVVESLLSTRSSSRVEDMIKKANVQFQATPAIVDILKEFGAGPKLISMIPPPLTPPVPALPPAPKTAGPLTIVCQPKDCVIAVDDKYEGSTEQNRKMISGLRPGEVTVQIFADGYDHLTRRIPLKEGEPKEEKFQLEQSTVARQNSGSGLLLKTVVSLGGLDGLTELSDVEVEGTTTWKDSGGDTQQWAATFNRRPGRNLAATFKSLDGQCTSSIVAQTIKDDCRGGLKGGGEKVAEQASSLFLSYQVQDVIQTLLRRPLSASDADQSRLESADAKDSYVLTMGKDGFPADLTYRIGDDQPIYVQYSNYMNIDKGWYPLKISVGRVNSPPSWVFTLKNVHSRIAASRKP